MDVHPPHEPVHSWREAGVHLAIMTAGLFIALMLEAGVEYLHHKELVRDARENIHAEIERNRKHAQQDVEYLGQSGDRIKAGVATLRYMQAHRDAKGQSIGYSLQFVDLGDSAWRTARDTGALGYMPLDEVQSFASLYELQENVEGEALHLLKNQAESLGPIMVEDDPFTHMSDAEFAAMRNANGSNFGDVMILQQLVRNLDGQYAAALKGK